MRPGPLHEVIETARIAALDSYAILDTPPEPQFEALAQEAAAAAAMPMAQISFLDRSRQWIKAATGPRPAAVPRHLAFCQGTLDTPAGLMWIADTEAQPRYERHPWVAGAPRIRSYAGAALIDHDGYRLGTLAAQDFAPRPVEPKVLERLGRLAFEVVALMERQRAERTEDFRAAVEQRWRAPAAEAPDDPPADDHRVVLATPLAPVVQGWLGVRTGPATHPGDGDLTGLAVLSVARASPAERAGVEIGDVLLSIGPTPIQHAEDILAALAQRSSGSEVVLLLHRDGAAIEASITVEPLPTTQSLRRRTSDRARR